MLKQYKKSTAVQAASCEAALKKRWSFELSANVNDTDNTNMLLFGSENVDHGHHLSLAC